LKEKENEKDVKCPMTGSKIKIFLKSILYRIEAIKYAITQIQKEGFSSLYGGLFSSVLQAVLQNSVYFGASKAFKILYDRMGYKNNISNELVKSLLSAIITCIVINPICVLNARMTKSSEKVLKFMLNILDWEQI
jgi:hypothetical protein